MLIILKCILSSLILFQAGHTLTKILNFKDSNIGFCEKGLLGLVFLSFIGLLINFFFPLNIFINSAIFTIFIFLCFWFKTFPVKEILITGIVATLIIYLANVNNPDGGLYHLPYIQILNEEKLIIGINNLHYRFALASMFQYNSAVFNNIYLGVNGITIPLSITVSYFLYYLHLQLVEFLKQNKDLNYFFSILYLIIIVSSLYSFNRYSNYGNDVPLHIFYIIIFLLTLKVLLNENSIDQFNLIAIFSIFLVINKITFIFTLLFPLLILLNLKEKKIFSLTNVFLIIFVFFWCLKNFLISGCLVFPISITCFESIIWTDLNLINQERLAGEAWSKGWIDQNKYSTYQEFLSNYNWLEVWFSKHFYIVLEKLLPIFIFICFMIITLTLRGKYLEKFSLKSLFNKKIYFLLLILFMNVALWFNFFPIYRYGYSYLVVFITILFLLIFIKFIKKPDYIYIKKYFLLFVFFGYLAFGIKNFVRIIENFHEDYVGKPFPNIHYSYYTKQNPLIQKKSINDTFEFYYAPNLCFYNKAPCTNYEIKNLNYKKIANYGVLYIK